MISVECVLLVTVAGPSCLSVEGTRGRHSPSEILAMGERKHAKCFMCVFEREDRLGEQT